MKERKQIHWQICTSLRTFVTSIHSVYYTHTCYMSLIYTVSQKSYEQNAIGAQKSQIQCSRTKFWYDMNYDAV